MLIQRFVICITLLSCMTPAKERQIDKDIFNLQTRLLQIEKTLEEKGAITASEADKKIAAVNTELEKLKVENQKIKGMLDELKVGVQTGKLPGTDPEQEGTLAHTINSIINRLEALEAAQTELLESLSKSNDPKESKTASKQNSASSLEHLKEAFEKRRFKAVAEDAPKVLKKTNEKAQKIDILYYYAESLYKLGNMREAALKYNDYIDLKPEKDKIAHATLRMGDCFRHLGDMSTAKIYYEELVNKYPNSQEAPKAKERLDEYNKTKGASVKKSSPIKKLAKGSKRKQQI